MSSSPLFTGTLCGRPLRFFPSPHEGPHFPWTIESDLSKALGMSRQHRKIVEQLHAEDIMNGAAKLIQIDRKVETIISYTTARALINAVEMSRLKARAEIERGNAIHVGEHVTELEWAFIVEAHKAMDLLTIGMSESTSLEYFIAAEKAEGGAL